MAEVAKSQLSAGEFYRLLVDGWCPPRGPRAARFGRWQPGELRLEYQVNLVTAPGPLHADVLATHQAAVEDVLASGQPRVGSARATPRRKSAGSTGTLTAG